MKKELISKIYDYITKVTIFQGKLLPVEILYGDGTRWEKDFTTFQAVYNAIKEILVINNIKY